METILSRAGIDESNHPILITVWKITKTAGNGGFSSWPTEAPSLMRGADVLAGEVSVKSTANANPVHRHKESEIYHDAVFIV